MDVTVDTTSASVIAAATGLAAALIVLWAAMRSPLRDDRLNELKTKAHPRARPDVFLKIGSVCVTRFKIELTNDELRIVGLAAVTSAVALVIYFPIAFGVPPLCTAFLWLRRRNASLARERAIVRDLPMTIDLLRLGVRSGLNVTGALGEVVVHTAGPLRDELALALKDVERGKRLSDALDEVARRSGEVLRPVIWSLTSTERYGAPLSEVLERLAHETRLDQEQRAEQAARRLSVQLLFPVAGCTLPAFALLTVVPLLAGSFTTLASSFI